MKKIDLRPVFSLLIVLALTILPLPNWLLIFQPAWVLLLFLFFQFYLPVYFRLSIVFFVGLCLDVLLATILGEHILALTLTVWTSSAIARRFYFYPVGQQMTLIFFYALIYFGVLQLTDGFLGYGYKLFPILLGSITSAIIWPWLQLLANDIFSKHPRYLLKSGPQSY